MIREGEAKKEIAFEGSSGKNDNLADAFQTLTDHYRKRELVFILVNTRKNALAVLSKCVNGVTSGIDPNAVGDGFKANAFAKVQKIISGWPTLITSSKDLKGVAGVGRGSAAKVRRVVCHSGGKSTPH